MSTDTNLNDRHADPTEIFEKQNLQTRRTKSETLKLKISKNFNEGENMKVIKERTASEMNQVTPYRRSTREKKPVQKYNPVCNFENFRANNFLIFFKSSIIFHFICPCDNLFSDLRRTFLKLFLQDRFYPHLELC